MNDPPWRRVDRVCRAALAAPAERRADVVDRLCAGDANLRREVESLLAQAPEAEGFLAAPAWVEASGAPTGGISRPGPDVGGDFGAAEALLAGGTRLGPYEVVAPVGAGGMGTVYQGRDTRLGRRVAIKVLPAGTAADRARRRRFEQEARAVSNLNHPHICALYDVGSDSGTDFLVMEFVAGETLAQRLARGPMPLEDAVHIGLQIADALGAAHLQGIVHCDLKPGNVMLTDQSGEGGLPQVKLLDFGLARLHAPSSAAPEPEASPEGAARAGEAPDSPQALDPVSATNLGGIRGTLPYMAPEQLEGRAVDARTDVWALGCVLHEMATGRRAFEGPDRGELIAAILAGGPPAMSDLSPGDGSGLDAVVTRCLAKDPDERWATMRDLAHALRELMPRPAGPPARAGRRRRVRMVGAVAFAALVAGALLGLGLWNRRGPSLSPRASEPVVGVLPFRSTAAQAEFDHLADGVTEALISGLAGKFLVVSSDSARRAAASGRGAAEAAARLGADRILEGTSFGDGRSVRFEARLLDHQGLALWAVRVEGRAEDVLQVQESLLRKVAAELGWSLPLEQRARARRIDPRAYALLVRARSDRIARTDLRLAMQALALSPDYADAHRVLAEGLAQQVYFGTQEGPAAAAIRTAREHADRALALEPADGLAYATRAVVRFVGGDAEGAEADFGRARALAPGSAGVLSYWAWFLAHFGRPDECTAAARELEALNPLTPTDNLGWCLWLQEKYAEAAAELERHASVRETEPLYLSKLASACARSGRIAEARAARDKVRALPSGIPGQQPGVDYHLIFVHLAEGDREGAERLADLWWRRQPKNGALWTFVAQMYGALDNVERTIEAASRSVDACSGPEPCAGGAAVLEQFYREPSFYSERVRGDPRIAALIRGLQASGR